MSVLTREAQPEPRGEDNREQLRTHSNIEKQFAIVTDRVSHGLCERIVYLFDESTRTFLRARPYSAVLCAGGVFNFRDNWC